MKKFLYGEVFVKVITIEALDEETATALLNESQKHELSSEEPFEASGFDKQAYRLSWGETPTSQAQHARNGVLKEFLRLMQQIIPFANKPEKSRIITPPEFGGGK